ncbi:MAG: hypothetical protein K2X47_06045 [Bdellovibrionales bacterium]|nr:hypothetical protein [Bdellovibrionales bacterium]
MRGISLTLWFFLFAWSYGSVAAEKVDNGLSATEQRHAAALKPIQDRIDQLQKWVSEKNEAVGLWRSELLERSSEKAKANRQYEDCVSKLTGYKAPTTPCDENQKAWRDRVDARMNDLNREITTGMRDVAQTQKNIRDLEASLKKVDTEYSDMETNLKSKLGTIRTSLSFLDLKANFIDFKSNFSDARQAYRTLENQLDDSMLSGFLQAKFGRLLSSKAFCAAKDACGGTRPDWLDLKEVFPASKRIDSKEGGVKVPGSAGF